MPHVALRRPPFLPNPPERDRVTVDAGDGERHLALWPVHPFTVRRGRHGAAVFRYRTGIPWRDLPERFGDGVAVHLRFSRWAKPGVWKRVFEHLAAEAENKYAMIDSNIVRAHQHSAGAQKIWRGLGYWAIARWVEH
jgi:transposase